MDIEESLFFLFVLLLELVQYAVEQDDFLGGLGLFLGFLFDFLFLLEAELGDALDEQEHDQRCEQEVHDSLNEASVADGDVAHSLYRGGDDDLEIGEVDAAENTADDRHKDVIDEGVDYRSERAAYDDADCQVEHIALGNEFFEFGYKLFSAFFNIFSFHISISCKKSRKMRVN